jgi:hypothetical protein
MLTSLGAYGHFTYKSWTARTNKGKTSVPAISRVRLGIIHKVQYNYDPVVFPYALNGSMDD